MQSNNYINFSQEFINDSDEEEDEINQNIPIPMLNVSSSLKRTNEISPHYNSISSEESNSDENKDDIMIIMALQRLEEIKNLINNQVNNVNMQFNKQKNKDLFIKRINTNKKLKYSAKFISIIKHRIIKQKRINYLENIRLKRKGMISLYKYSFVNQIYKKHLLKYVRSFINIIHTVIKIKKYYKYVSIKYFFTNITSQHIYSKIKDFRAQKVFFDNQHIIQQSRLFFVNTKRISYKTKRIKALVQKYFYFQFKNKIKTIHNHNTITRNLLSSYYSHLLWQNLLLIRKCSQNNILQNKEKIKKMKLSFIWKRFKKRTLNKSHSLHKLLYLRNKIKYVNNLNKKYIYLFFFKQILSGLIKKNNNSYDKQQIHLLTIDINNKTQNLNLLRNKNDEIIHHLNEYKDYYKQITLELNEVKERNVYLQNKKQTDKDKVNEIISQNRMNIQNLKNVIINNQSIINSNNIKNEKQFQLHHNTTIPNTNNVNNNTHKITVQQKQEVVNVFNPKKKFQDKLKSFK